VLKLVRTFFWRIILAFRQNRSQRISVGDTFIVGESVMWIKTCIGFSRDAKHGHNNFSLGDSGSADPKCKVQVLEIDHGVAKVLLIREKTPFGAPSPHGTIFLMPVNQLKGWVKILPSEVPLDKRSLQCRALVVSQEIQKIDWTSYSDISRLETLLKGLLRNIQGLHQFTDDF